MLLFHTISNFGDIYVGSVDAPSITIPGSGVLTGKYLKMYRTKNIKAYLGIQYAYATRFSPPDIEIPPWKGIFNATSFGPNCWQQETAPKGKQTDKVLEIISGEKNEAETTKNYEENCLYLNVFVPDGPPGINGYAVVVWIHSGDFSVGSPHDVEPFQLVFKQKLIVVTFSYRLNIFGFFSTDDGEAQGNYGLMDQSAALYWIKRNINFFGGDDTRITLMGHGAGAISVGLHMTSGEWSKGAFHKAILMSGNPIMDKSVKLPKEYDNALDMIANTFGCVRKPTSMLIQCLKRVDAKIISENLPSIEWGPVVDFGLSNISYPFIENLPVILFQSGNYHKVPVIVGVTDMEEALILFNENFETERSSNDLEAFLNDIAMSDIHQSVENEEWCSNFALVSDALNFIYSGGNKDTQAINQKLVEAHTEKLYIAPLQMFMEILSKHQQVYGYLFKFHSQSLLNGLPNWISVPKYFDQVYVWGIPYMNNNMEWNSTDKKIADIIMTLWANFAKSSNPTKSNIYVKWNEITPVNNSVLIIDENFNTDSLADNHRIQFWNNFYPKVLKFSSECCNSTNLTSIAS
ncbi:carboxylesterase 5A [Scaptodrosophila lebanonensis]|uniref:Carboxylesterase 5A n=1 Tax=Drosophila lebanonensis TaxID=7225 RepID=A0A6J2U5N3_DROLE|nr:carboxylesterase 5A [Scaptodrosophila lebanonensis]